MHRTLPIVVACAVVLAAASAVALGVSAAPQATRIEIVALADTTFDPDEFWVDPGELVTVTLTNADPFGRHDIVFELNDGRVARVDPISLGRSSTLDFVAPSALGEYPYYSSVGNDRANGMEGVLHVGDEPTATPPPSPTGGGSTTRTPTPTRTEAPEATPTITAVPTGEGPPHETVVEGLLNPHGLTLSVTGTLLVSEGGTGAGPSGEFSPGNGDGRVQDVDVGDAARLSLVLDAVSNVVDPAGGVYGPNHGIWWSRDAGATGTATVAIVAIAAGPDEPQPYEAAKIIEVAPGGGRVLADTLAFEAASNPDGGDVRSSPWRLVPSTDASGQAIIYVVDTAANDVLIMDPDTGELSLYAWFDPIDDTGQVEAAPSGLAVDPGDPAVSYVALSGGARRGRGRIVRLADLNGDGDALDDGESTLWVDGLSMPSDLAFSPAGPMARRLFVLQLIGGTVSLVDAAGRPPVEVAQSLPGCSGMVFEADGDLLVSVGSEPGSGGPTLQTDRVVRVDRDDLAPSLPPSATPPVTGTPPTATPGTPEPSVTPDGHASTIYLPYTRAG